VGKTAEMAMTRTLRLLPILAMAIGAQSATECSQSTNRCGDSMQTLYLVSEAGLSTPNGRADA
jgi:hypothetical protein